MYSGYKCGTRKSQSCFSRGGGSYCECKGHDASRKSLNAWRYCTESTKSIHRTALYRQCNLPETRRTTFFLFFFFFASFASIYSSRRHLTPSWDRPHLAHAPTYKNFICLPYAIISILVYYIFSPDIRSVFFFFYTNDYANVNG